MSLRSLKSRLNQKEPMDGDADITPEEWPRVERLLDRLLEGLDLAQAAAGESDPAIIAAAQRLWENDRSAIRDGFLEPIPLMAGLAAPVQPSFSNGQVLIGRFQIERLLGTGGMGEVYLAFDNRLNQQVAIKTIRRDLAANPSVCRRFVAEVQNARRVTHPNVCRINELFDEGGTPFLCMEYLEGPHLSDWLRAGPLRRKEAGQIALDLAQGLAAAHRSGIVHGDFKPANVILTGDAAAPRVVITDFGLAYAFYNQLAVPDVAPAPASLHAGTRRYMAPELLNGGSPSIATDIYAYGRVLEELLPGHRVAAQCTAANPKHRPAAMSLVINALGGKLARRLWLAGASLAAFSGWGAWAVFSRPGLDVAAHQRVAVNGFRAANSQKAFAIRELFLTALRESPRVIVLTDKHIAALLHAAHYPSTLPANPGSLIAATAHDGALVIDGALEVVGVGLRLLLRVFLGGSRPAFSLTEEVPHADRMVQLAERAAIRLRRAFREKSLPEAGYLSGLTSSSPIALDYYFQGLMQKDQLAPESAAFLFEKAVQEDPSFAAAELQLGIALVTAERVADGFEHYEKAFALRKSTSEHERLWIEGRYYNIVNDFDNSLASCTRLVLLNPYDPDAQHYAAFAATRAGRPREALPHNDAALELDPDNERNRSEWLVNRCDVNRFDEALERYRQFRLEGDTKPLLEWGAGLAYTGKGDFDSARAAFERYHSANGEDDYARLVRRIPMIASGSWRDAVSELVADLRDDDITREQTWNLVRHYWLGMMYVFLDEPSRADAHAEILCRLEAKPYRLQSVEEGALLALEIGDTAFAAAALDTLRIIEKNWPSKHASGARLLIEGLREPDPYSAATFLLGARDLWPDPITLYAVGRFQNRQGNFEAARTELQGLEEARGRAYRLFFPGLVALGRVELGRALAGLSLYGDSLRFYRQVLGDWGLLGRGPGRSAAPQCSLTRRIQDEFQTLRTNTQGGRKEDD
jgi:tetratricopeptide (TPR) repeat protein